MPVFFAKAEVVDVLEQQVGAQTLAHDDEARVARVFNYLLERFASVSLPLPAAKTRPRHLDRAGIVKAFGQLHFVFLEGRSKRNDLEG